MVIRALVGNPSHAIDRPKGRGNARLRMAALNRPRIGVVGAGRLGASLAVALARASYQVTVIGSARVESARAVAAAVGADVVATADLAEVPGACDLIFLAVPDDAIETVAARLPVDGHHEIVHCSGAFGLEVLRPVTIVGARVGCLHPLQSFPSPTPEPERFRGISCGVEGEEPLGRLLQATVLDLGARPILLEGVDRAFYHAAAVFASNDVIALMSAARRAWALAGLPAESARQALAPLLLSTARALSEMDLKEALTGPVTRGDVRTVETHLAALAAEPSLEELYRRLAAELLKVSPPADRGARAHLIARLGAS